MKDFNEKNNVANSQSGSENSTLHNSPARFKYSTYQKKRIEAKYERGELLLRTQPSQQA